MYVMFHNNGIVPSLYLHSVSVLVQLDKDIRHPVLLEQPSLHAAISSWHTDFELQEIFRKGKTKMFKNLLKL